MKNIPGSRVAAACVFAWTLFHAATTYGQVSYALNGPMQVSSCDRIALTNIFLNTGNTLDGLIVTQQLPHSGFAYVTNRTRIILPSGTILSNAAAEPASNSGSNLVWNFSSVSSSSTFSTVLISEVFYDPTNSPEDAFEWIELYNPLSSPVVMNGWSIRDALPGQTDTLPNFTINPGEFVIIAATTNGFFTSNPGYTGRVFQVADGTLGSGLNNFADGITLRNNLSVNQDAVSYGGSTAAFSPSVPLGAQGQSLRRTPVNADSNTRNDWAAGSPNPGSGTFQFGLTGGSQITLIYEIEIACGAPAGQVIAKARYNQPAGGASQEALASIFITVNPGDLTITKSPNSQSAAVGDTVVWTVTVKNEGFGNAPNVVLTDIMGAGFTFTSFSVNPTNLAPFGSQVVWDKTVIPALSNLAPQQEVSVVVTALMVACNGFFNRANARWGCQNMLTISNGVCEDTALNGETAGASVILLEKYPSLSGSASAIPFNPSYCGNSNLVLYLTNASGVSVGPAQNIVITNTLPAGWTLTGSNVLPNGTIQVGNLAPGASTSVVVRVQPGGTCPLPETPQGFYFLPQYSDACGTPFSGPLIFTSGSLTNKPQAQVRVITPPTVDTCLGPYPVSIELAYTNFTGGEVITLTNVVFNHPNLYPTNISPGGVRVGNRIIWSNLVPGAGSGVLTTRFNIAISSPCAGPSGPLFDTIYASSFTDCNGCSLSVLGSGSRGLTAFIQGGCCPPGSNGCSVATSKTISTNLQEVCTPVILTHTLSNISVTNSTWSGLQFTSDLGGGQGYLDTSNGVVVRVNGSNVTSFVSFTQVSPSLILNLAGLNASPFPGPNVATNLTVTWPVSVSSSGQLYDVSGVNLCDSFAVAAEWYVGLTEMGITLQPFLLMEACGLVEGRIDLTQFSSPDFPVNRVFPAYDVQVVLDLDAESSGFSSLSYITNSTAFSNFFSLGGAPLSAVEPTVQTNRVIWNLGDLRTNGVGYITYRLQGSCSQEPGERHVARVLFNNRCGDGTPPSRSETSLTNAVPPALNADLNVKLKPEIRFLQDNRAIFTLEFVNGGAGTAFNVVPEFVIPTGLTLQGASIAPSTVTATNMIWTLALTNSVGDLADMDGDGAFDDLPSGGDFFIIVTNTVQNCLQSTVRLRATHGCKGVSCQTPVDDTSEFEPLLGSLVTRSVFPAAAKLCGTNTARYEVRNSGLTVDRVVQVDQLLPLGMTYVSNSARYVVGGVTNPAGHPAIIGNTLTFTQTNVPPFMVLQPGEEIAILYDVYVGCDAVNGDNTFVARGRYVDVCGNLVSNLLTSSVMPVDEPLLNITKEALNQDGVQTNFIAGTLVADPGDRVVYRITIQHDPASEASVLSMNLNDTLPAEVRFDGASIPPSATNFPGGLVQLVWSNSALMSLVGGSPWSEASLSNVTILITGTVTNCTSAAINTAEILYGCDPNCLSLSDSTAHTLSSEIDLRISGSSSLTLGSCGGTRVLGVTNLGSTASGLIITNVAPPGYVFYSGSITGEFNSSSVTLFLTGTPVGSTAIINLSTTNSSRATDRDDDAANGIDVLDIGYLDGFSLTLNLRSDGTGLDCLADPTDLDFADPDPINTGSKSTTSSLSLANPCGDPRAVSGTSSDLPDLPDPDIDLQPNSVIVTNGQVVTFTATVRNIAEQGNADNLHIRLRFGTGWTNLTLVSSNIVSSGTSALTYEQQGHTNVLVTLPGVILDPVDDQVVLTFTAQAVQGPGSFFARAEVVGVCTDPNIVPGCTFTNTLGEAPLANTMTGSVINAVNGRYYGFDQDQTFGAGYSLEKTVRYRTEPAPGSATRTARIGEDLTYRIRAEYFGATFSNVVVNESLPTNLVFGVPVDAGSSATVSNWTWDAGTGAFTLPSPITSNALFVVDIPVIARNSFTNQGEAGNQTIITNLVDSVFTVNGVTNDPPSSGTFVPVLEPNLSVVKSVSVGTNFVQAGDVIVFSNVVRHTGLSLTNAYDVFFTDTLPAGLTFSGLDFLADGFDNDGDGVTDEADEATLVSGNTITVTTNHNANLFLLATNQAFTVVFPALVTNQIVGTVVTNVSQIQWTSLPGFGTNGNERTGVDGTNGLNNYVTSGAVPLRYEAVRSIAKTVLSTSQTNTVDVGTTNQLTIGERIVYRIRVEKPQGISSPFTVTDLVPPGLDWVGSNPDTSLAFPGLGYRFTIPNPNLQLPTNAPRLIITDTDPTPASSTTSDGSDVDITFAFGTVTNVADGNLTNDFFFLDMEFVVLDIAINDGTGPTFYTSTNRAQVIDGGTTLLATSPVYQIVDFDIGTVKSVTPNTFDAGDTLTISVVVSNLPFNLSRIQAYDVLATDFLPNSLYSTSTATIISTPVGWGADFIGSATGLLYRLFTTNDTALAIGQAVTGRFTIAAGPNVSPNLRATNVVLAVADTIYGSTPTGIVSRGDSVTNTALLVVTNLSFAKALEATSETGAADSTTTNVQVGEIVTYRLTVRLPEVTVTNLVITDDLPVGMSYILGSARTDTSAFGGTLGTLTVDAPTGSPGTLAPNSSNVTIRFAGATVVTGDNDTNNNSFAVFLDAIVLNTNTVNGILGSQTRLTNSATLTYAGNPSNAVPSGDVITPVIEPVLAITKTITNTLVDAGDRITVTLVMTNSGLATAYNLEARDPLNPLFFDVATVTNTLLPTGYVFAVETNTVVIRADTNSAPATNTLEIGESLTVAFDVTISSNLPPNTIFTNVALISYADSISGVKTIDQQRAYGPTQSVDVLSSPNLSLAKVLVGTSETGPVDTTGTNVTIGEVVTYRLTVTVPEGTITNLAVTDDLPIGMTFFTNVTVDTTGFGGTLPGAPTIANAGGSGGDVTFTFNGLTRVTGDNLANNSFTITFDALVMNVAANDGLPASVDGTGLTILTNRGSVTYAGNPSNAVPSGVVIVQVVEPALLITKNMTGPSNRLVVLSLTVTNRGLSTAFDVVVTDLVSTVWFDTTTLAPVSVPAGFTYAASGAPGPATVTFASDPLSGQPTNSIEVGESLVFQFSALLIPGASGRITNTAVVATNTTTDGPNPDERVEPRTNSTAFLNLPSFTVTKTRTSPLGRPADVGEAVTFRLTVTNTGPVGFSSVSLTDTFDSVYLAFSNATPTQTSAGAGLITWANVGPLPVNAATNVFVTFRALTSTLPGDTTNIVVASLVTTNGGPLPPQTSSAPVAVAQPSYILNKERLDPVNGVATQGQLVVFRLSVTNNGEVGLSPVRLDDTFDPAILTFSSATPAQSSAGAGSLTWNNVGPLAVGGTASVTVRFTTVSSTWPGDTTNVVVSTVSTTNGTPLAPQTSSAPVRVANPQIGLTKLAGNAPDGGVHHTNAGANVIYTYIVTNSGNTHLVSMTVTDNVLGVIGTLPGPLAPGATDFLLYTSAVPVAVTNIGVVSGTPSDSGGTPIPGLPPVRDDDDAIVRIFASLGNFVWLDTNGNGVQDGGSETGIPSVVVNLYGPSTNLLGSTATDANGFYSFTNLVPGTYFVGFVAPSGLVLSPQDRGGDDTLDSDASTVTGYTIPTVLISGENDPTWDAGLYAPASLGNFVWLDANRNGVQDGGSETGIPSVVVNLLSNSIVIATTTTDVNGAYAFTNLPPGDYAVRFTPPTGFEVTLRDIGGDTTDSDADPVTGETIVTTLISGENDPTWDAGLFQRASLGNFVWLDVNGDGIQSGGSETGIPSVVVNLLSNGTVIATTTTDVNGAYAFTNLVPATYAVEFVPPTGFTITQPDLGGNDALDSDADPVTGRTILTTLVSGENDLSWDAGLYIPASLGNFVWLDANRNGVQDGGSETGIPSVVVNLLSNSIVIATTTTDVNGAYAFTNLPPGDYAVRFTPPTGFEVTLRDIGGDTTDSDADPVTGETIVTTLISGENDPTWDAGLFQRASLGNFVWLDVNGDGIQSGGSETGIPSVVVNLLSNGTVIATTTTDVNGAYAFTNLVPATYAVEFVPPGGYAITQPDLGGNDALDSDADPVTGRTILTTLVSGENDLSWDAGLYIPASLGNFVWLDANRNGVQDGGSETGIPSVVVNLLSNSIVIATTTTDVNGAYAFTNLPPGDYAVRFTPPTGFEVTQRDIGGDTTDSDADPVTGETIVTTLISGENDPTWDAGLFQRASLGNFVWLDVNRNGAQDGGSETGLPDVVVNLLSNGTVIATTTTDVNGAYAFTNLVPATYVVEFVPPSGFEITLRDNAGDGVDSDADLITGRTTNITLESGENDLTWDAGLFQRSGLGNFVWLDRNGDGIQSGGSETGIPDVVVNLLSNGLVIATTTTDVNGAYAFNDLVPGDYAVEFVPPSGFVISPRDLGGNDALDSDADPVTGRTIVTTLSGGEFDPTWDAGLYIPASLGNFVWLDINGDGIQSGGSETGIPGVVVNLLTNGTVFATTTTDVNGAYAFTNLRPNDYAVEFVPPVGYLVTVRDEGGDDTADSDPDRVTGRTIVTTLESGENDPTWDAGLYIPASLGNFVWLDVNGDGIQSGGSETGIPNVVVNLLSNGTVIATTTTDVSGAYAFTNLIPGAYAVEFVSPIGFVFTQPDLGGDDTTDSDANPATGRTITTVLVSGENDPTWDAGLYIPASLGNFVWLDANADGIQGGGNETGIPQVVVSLLSNGTVIATTTTDVNGAYAFTNLPPGDYAVEFQTPSGFELTFRDVGGNDGVDSDPDRTTGRTIVTTLVSGENDPTWDAGLFQRASLGNYVWLDDNLNGIQDGSEPGVSNVVVNLYDVNDVIIATTTTDVNGAYAFTNLVPESYYVGFVLPPDYQFTTPNLGGDDTLDSDASQSTGLTTGTILLSGDNDTTWDAGLYRPRPGIQLIKVAGDAADGDVEYILPGEDVVYTYTVINTGNTYLISVTVTDDVLGVVGTIAGPLAPGLSSNLFLTAFAVTQDVTNVAVVVGTPSDQGGTTLPFLTPVRDDDPAIVDVVSPGYTLVKNRTSPTGRAAQVGEGVDFEITLVNTGDVTLVTVPVVDTYETTYLTFTGAVPPTVDVSNDGTLDWLNVGPVPAGASTTLVVRFVAAASSLSLDRTNTVVASPTVPPTVPPVFPKTNEAPYAVSQAGYLLTKVRTAPAGSARIGDPVTFQITIQNTGDVAFVTLPVTDRYETVYLTYTGAVPVSVDNNNDGEIVWTDVGPLPVGASTTLVVNFLAAGSSAGLNRTNTVTTWPTTPPDEPPVPPSTSQAPYRVSISGYELIKTRISPTNRPAVVEENVVFELTVRNTGDVALATVPLEDTYETAYLAFSNAVPPVDDVANDGVLNWTDVGPVAPGASTSVVVTFQAIASSDGLNRTNTVIAAPTVPPGDPPVFPKTNEAPYAARFGWLGDTVWVDLDSDGLPDENLNAQGLNGIQVRLFRILNGATSLVDTVSTVTFGGQRGYYLFTNLVLGLYQVEVDLTTVPSNLDVITTARRINAELTPNGFFINADFGFIAARPTEVSLMYFRGAPVEGGVSLTWATASERENLGYHLYRADSADGAPQRITADLIPGAGTGEGRAYQWLDSAAEAGEVYYYWLEDVEYDGDTTRHGPVRVHLGEESLPGVPFLVEAGGVYVVTAQTLADAGLPVYSMNADELTLTMNGEPAALFTPAEKRVLREGEAVLVYVPEGGADLVFGAGPGGLRMESVYAGPSWDEGETWLGVAEQGRVLAFTAQPGYVRYLLADFEGSDAWVLDISRTHQPRLLIGVETIRTAQGTGFYLSYPVTEGAACLAVTPQALRELTKEHLKR